MDPSEVFHLTVLACRNLEKGTVSEVALRVPNHPDRIVFVPNGSGDEFIFYFWADWEDNTVKFHYENPTRYGVVAKCKTFKQAMKLAEENALATSQKYLMESKS